MRPDELPWLAAATYTYVLLDVFSRYVVGWLLAIGLQKWVGYRGRVA